MNRLKRRRMFRRAITLSMALLVFVNYAPAPARALRTQASAAVPIWPDGAPGALGSSAQDQPSVVPYLPPAERRTGERLGFTVEPRQAVWVGRHRLGEHLDRHLPTELRVGGLIDLAHAPDADFRRDLVWAEAGAGGECHWLPRSQRQGPTNAEVFIQTPER